MDKIQKIQDYIIELYGMVLKDGELNSEAKKMTNDLSIKNWSKVLKNYSEEEIKYAIDFYYKFKNNKTTPKLNQIQKILNSENKEECVEQDNSYLDKPVCPISHWQEDFDYILRKACVYGFIYNPYWSEQEEVKKEHKEFIKDFSYHKIKFIWDDCLKEAIKAEPEKYKKIEPYDYIIKYVLAYRLGFLEKRY
jgi:hypothetical protein